MRAAPSLILGLFLLAGCLGAKAPPAVVDKPAPVDWAALGASVYSDNHDHKDRSLHQSIEQGLRVMNASTLNDKGPSLGEYNEIDTQRGLIAAAVVTGPGSTMRITLLDQAALPALKIVGAFDEPSSYGDVKLDPGLPLVYVPYASKKAFSVWDIADVAHPKRVGEVQGAGCHMLHVLHIEPNIYVFCATVGGTEEFKMTKLPNGEWTGTHNAMVTPQSDPETTRYADYYRSLSPLGPALITTPHDQTAQIDPITAKPILVTAHELQGIRIYDLTVPEAPREISHWRGASMNVPMDRVHTVGIAAVNGHRYGFAATETFTDVQPSMYIVDFTDWNAPHFVARWSPPGIPHDQGITYSLHNLQVVGTRLYVTNFHAGLWVLNISDPAHPKEIALRTPVRDVQYPRPGEHMQIGKFAIYNDMNQFWDVNVENGYVIVSDMAAGLEVLHVDGDPAGEPSWKGFT
jgi:hypothetical protein